MPQLAVAVIADHLDLALEGHVGVPELEQGDGELLLGGGGLVHADEGQVRLLLLARRHREVEDLGAEAGAGAQFCKSGELELIRSKKLTKKWNRS